MDVRRPPDWLRAAYRKIAPPHLAHLLAPQTGPITSMVVPASVPAVGGMVSTDAGTV